MSFLFSASGDRSRRLVCCRLISATCCARHNPTAVERTRGWSMRRCKIRRLPLWIAAFSLRARVSLRAGKTCGQSFGYGSDGRCSLLNAYNRASASDFFCRWRVADEQQKHRYSCGTRCASRAGCDKRRPRARYQSAARVQSATRSIYSRLK